MPSISKTDSVRLQDVSIAEIKEIMENQYESSYSKLDILNENSNGLIYLTKHRGNHAKIEFSRRTHRPLDLYITAEYTSSNLKDETFKSTSSKFLGSLSRFAYGIISVLVIIALIYFVFIFRISLLSNLFGSFSLAVLLLLLIGFTIYQFVPEKDKFGYKQKEERLEQLLSQVKDIILQLRENSASETIKCWNCFKEIDKNNNNCPLCGKSQK